VTPAPSNKKIAKWRGRHFALMFFSCVILERSEESRLLTTYPTSATGD